MYFMVPIVYLALMVPTNLVFYLGFCGVAEVVASQENVGQLRFRKN
jgi:hypothetical protein